MKRPLLLVGITYATGILLADLIHLPLALVLGVAALLVLATILWERSRAVVLWPAILLAGWTNLLVHTAILSPNDLRLILGKDPELVTARGVLRETPTLRFYEEDHKEPWHTMARLELSVLRKEHQTWRPAHGVMVATVPGILTNYFAGQEVEVVGVSRTPKFAAAEGTFDYQSFLRRQGIYFQLRTDSSQDWRIISAPARKPIADRFREWAMPALALGLPVQDESYRLECALTLGWKTALTEQVSEPFVQAATYHIFAVDGLRMMILFGIFLTLLRVLGVPWNWCGVLVLPIIWFYTALTGWPASAIRAAVMVSVVAFGWILRRPVDVINSLFAAALILLTWQPGQLFQAGFQLSFVVVLALIGIIPSLQKFFERLLAPNPFLPESLQPRWRKVLASPIFHFQALLLTSFAAWIGALPLVAYYFHIITPVSTPANILAVPLCALVLMSNFASLFFQWCPPVAVLFNHAGWALMEWIRITSQWFARWYGAYYYVPAPSLFTTLLFYAVLLALVSGWLFRPAFRKFKFGLLSVALVTWIVLFCREHTSERLDVLALRGGSVVHFPAWSGRGVLLVDCGTTNAAQMITKPFLRAQGVNKLPMMVLTHGDLQNVAAAPMLDSAFSIPQIIASPIHFRSPVYRRALERFQQTPGKVRTVSRDDTIGTWRVLHPKPDEQFSQADDNAIVLQGTLAGTRILLLSDLGRRGQAALLEREQNLLADIVVAGIPVAGEPLRDDLLDAIQPKVVVIADSEFPVSAQAGPKLRARLERRNIPVIYLRSSGSITFEMRSKEWTARTTSGLVFHGSVAKK